MNTQIICIVGPTASGKTALSVQIAKKLHSEIVSADSVQVYHELDIGSARPTLKDRDGIVHHLLDFVDLDDRSFSVASYYSIAYKTIEDLLKKEITPVVVGGSGLYIAALTRPLNFAVPSDEAKREKLAVEYDNDPEEMFEKLKRIDPETGKRLHLHDRKRIVRAMEVFELSGRTLSSYGNDFYNDVGKDAPFRSVQIGIRIPREVLYERINHRVDQMISDGLIEEAKRIYDCNYDRSLPALQALGYKELFDYFDGCSSLEEAVKRIKQNTRRFAKRQMTWFKRDPSIHWIEYDGTDSESLFAETMGILKENGIKC